MTDQWRINFYILVKIQILIMYYTKLKYSCSEKISLKVLPMLHFVLKPNLKGFWTLLVEKISE